ncbi:MAG: TonB-dependent receptor [Halioglobus sp.]|nr:TonB-dependent receptor [Halioglobus sp.]
MSVITKPIPALSAALVLSTASHLAFAQQLEEVVVTAQKRVESLQDVPISVVAMQGEQIQQAGIQNMMGLSDYVPNLHIAVAPVNTNIYMRGVGSGNNQGFEQSVGMYIDGIYMGRGRQYRNAFLDLERVEILRGPQGTLFGRNTVAGAVSVITASPTLGEELNGALSVAGESHDGFLTEGHVGSDITDNLAMRFAFKYRESDGWIDNAYLEKDEPKIKDTTYRLTTVWQPIDALDINFKYTHSDEKRTGSTAATWLYLSKAERDELVPNRSPFAIAAYSATDENFPQLAEEAGRDFTAYRDNNYGSLDYVGLGRKPDGDKGDVDNGVLALNYELDEYIITSITGYTAYDVTSGADVDWLPLRFIARDDDEKFDQWSQELRIQSPGGAFIDYTAGLYYDTSTYKNKRLVVIDGTLENLFASIPGNLLNPGLPPIPIGDSLGVNSLVPVVTDPLLAYTSDQVGRNHEYILDSKSYAAFVQGMINLTEEITLTLGLRYTRETKDVKSNQFLIDDSSGYNARSNNFYLGQVQATQFNTYAYNYKENRETDDWIPSAVLQWNYSDDSMVYASFSQGFKSGGFTGADDGQPDNLPLASWPCVEQPDGSVDISACYNPNNPSDDFEFEDETVDAFEVGGKHRLLDGAMTFNWAAFYSKYDNLQTAIFKGVGFGVTNAGSVDIKGIEIESRWAASDMLTLGANLAWLDATYGSFKEAPCTAIQLDANPQCGVLGPSNVLDTFNDLDGEKTLYASDYSASVTWDFVYPLNNMDAFVSGEANYRDAFNSNGDNDPVDKIDSYTKVNLRLGLRTNNWELMAYSRNVFDEAAITQSFDVPILAGSHAYVMEEGRIYGLRATYMF